MPTWRWILGRLTRRLWVRTAVIGALGILAAILAAVVENYIPWQLPGSIGAESVDGLLTIIASSMLAVTTFSLSTMVSAYGSATSNVTPRATKLLTEDSLTQSVLSTFVGSFLFSIVGLIVLRTGAYGERGRVVLFIMTIAVIVLVVVALLRWIDHLTRLGRVGETTDLVEDAARRAIEERLETPYLGGTAIRPEDEERIAAGIPVTSERIGYVQNVDMPWLSQFCEEHSVEIFVKAVPGTFVFGDTPLAWITDLPEGVEATEIRGAFVVAGERSFEQDPRFGVAVLAEIGCRALSLAINDPGTAIDVVGRLARLLSSLANEPEEGEVPQTRYPRVHVPPLEIADLFEDAFMTIGRDGANLVEVQLRLQKALLSLSHIGDEGFRAAALHQSRMALDRAEASMVLEADKQRLRDLVAPMR